MKRVKTFEVEALNMSRRRRGQMKAWWIWDYDQFYDLCEEIFDVMEEEDSPNLNLELAHTVVIRYIGETILIEQGFIQLREMVNMVLSLWSNALEIALSFEDEETEVTGLRWVGNGRYKYEFD